MDQDDKFTVLYIDEEVEEVHAFERKLSDDFNIKTINITDTTKEAVIEKLEAEQFDYLIVDYHLNETGNIGFDGDDILSAFLQKFPDFPFMLLTNHDQQAMENATDLDVEKIRSKSEYSGPGKTSFVKRINAKIVQYRKSYEEDEQRVKELVLKKTSADAQLSAEEEDELIKLDTRLDNSLGGNSAPIPDELKKSTNVERLDTLLNKTDALLEKLEGYASVQK